MELPEQFKRYDYLIDIIRKLINPNYLKTKEECLKWYIWHMDRKIINQSIFDVDSFLQQNEFPIADTEFIYHNLLVCSIVKRLPNGEIYYNNIDEKYVFGLLKSVTDIYLERVLRNMIYPFNTIISTLVEKDLGRKIYPLDKNVLFEASSLKAITHLKNFFYKNDFIETISEDIIIKNEINDVKIVLSQNLFNTYCHFKNLIELTQEDINTIIVPFSFCKKAAQYFLSCLIMEQFLLPNEDITDEDYNEFKQLMLYFQVIFK